MRIASIRCSLLVSTLAFMSACDDPDDADLLDAAEERAENVLEKGGAKCDMLNCMFENVSDFVVTTIYDCRSAVGLPAEPPCGKLGFLSEDQAMLNASRKCIAAAEAANPPIDFYKELSAGAKICRKSLKGGKGGKGGDGKAGKE